MDFTVENFRKGEFCIFLGDHKKDGKMVKVLRDLFLDCWPNLTRTQLPGGNYDYYWADPNHDNHWNCGNRTPTHISSYCSIRIFTPGKPMPTAKPTLANLRAGNVGIKYTGVTDTLILLLATAFPEDCISCLGYRPHPISADPNHPGEWDHIEGFTGKVYPADHFESSLNSEIIRLEDKMIERTSDYSADIDRHFINNALLIHPDEIDDDDGSRILRENNPVRPDHYNQGKIEVADFINDQDLNFNRGNGVKYLCRAGKKDKSKEIEDLEKVIKYTQFEICRLKNESVRTIPR